MIFLEKSNIVQSCCHYEVSISYVIILVAMIIDLVQNCCIISEEYDASTICSYHCNSNGLCAFSSLQASYLCSTMWSYYNLLQMSPPEWRWTKYRCVRSKLRYMSCRLSHVIMWVLDWRSFVDYLLLESLSHIPLDFIVMQIHQFQINIVVCSWWIYI